MGSEQSTVKAVKRARAKKADDEFRFARNKLAFDSVIMIYTGLYHSNLYSSGKGLKALDYAEEAGGCVNPMAATPIDFQIDVEKVLQPYQRKMFWELFLNVHVRDVMSILDVPKDVQHVFNNYEQKIGAEFIRNEMFPVRKYFTTNRGK